MPDPRNPNPSVSHHAPPTPARIDLKRDERLRIEWSNGAESTYPITELRQLCPCAACKMLRTGKDPHQLMQPDDATREQPSRGANEHDPSPTDQATPSKPAPQRKTLSLSVLPRNFASADDAITVTHAELVGNYALKLVFSDGHDTGIYSFAYLREIGDVGHR